MSNFDFLKDFDEKLYRLGIRVENEVTVSPSGVLAESTRFLQHFLNQLLKRIGLKFNSRKDFYDQLDAVYRKGVIDYKYKNTIYSAYMLRNKLHADIDEIEKDEDYIAMQLYEKLYTIAKKYYRDFNDDYDSYEGLPAFRPIEMDTTDDEIERIRVPDFSDLIDIDYDYCVICGEPNHSNYSLCCHRCNRVMDNANNFISIRNSFGKDAKFTKEDLIEFGIHEGYANQLIHTLAVENMFKVKGRFIEFNNLYMDEYLKKIDSYIAVCELITKFCEDEILPAEIKQTREYREGSKRQEPFYQFYKVIDREVINKFEKDILATENIWESIEYTTITEKQLESWYMKNLNFYHKGNVNESFVVFNNLLMADYIDLKREGLPENEIKSRLNVSQKVYDFWVGISDSFEGELAQIKKDLILKALADGKTKHEAMEIAGVTPHEYDNLYKVSNYYSDDYAQEINEEMEARKVRFTSYLDSLDLETSCRYAKITVDDFFEWYDNAKLNSGFYQDTTKILMGKYLDERKKGRSKMESIETIGLNEKYLNHWLNRSLDICKRFKDEDLRVTVDLVLRGFKWGEPIDEVCRLADVTENTIRLFLKLGARGSEIHKPLFEYYENKMIPKKLEVFLRSAETKPIRNALDLAYLSEGELEKYYELGKSGDERFKKFSDDFYDIKKGTYVYHINSGKSHNIAMKESRLAEEEYNESRDEMETAIRRMKIVTVIDTIMENKTSNIAARNAGCSVDEIYEWYFMGRDGDEEYEKFYELFHSAYVRPNINGIQKGLDYKNYSLDNIVRSNKGQFTKKDVEIWLEHGLISNVAVNLDKSKDDDDSKSKFDANEMLREMGVEDYDRVAVKKPSASSGILNRNDYDAEKLKKQILKK